MSKNTCPVQGTLLSVAAWHSAGPYIHTHTQLGVFFLIIKVSFAEVASQRETRLCLDWLRCLKCCATDTTVAVLAVRLHNMVKRKKSSESVLHKKILIILKKLKIIVV